MAVTIEQRLREMEVVNVMLRAAMAEDGDEDDEVKEAYGKQADEELTHLRSKLEEARRNEGKSPLTVSGNAQQQLSEPRGSDATLETKLVESQQQVLRFPYIAETS